MDRNELIDGLASGRLTRRDLGKAMAAVGVGMLTLPVLARHASGAETGQVEYFTWATYQEPALFPGFIEQYGHPPEVSVFGEEEEALQKMRAGYTPDVAHPCSYSVPRWRDAGVLKPIDAGRLEHYGDLFPQLKTINGTNFDGSPYFAPYDWGNSSVMYRTDLVDSNTDSWMLLFDEKYAGRLATYDSVDGAIASAALALGFKNIATLDDDQLAEVKKLLVAQKPLLRYYWTDNTALEQSMASGEIVAAYAWNSSYHALKSAGVPVAYMNPKEGILTWVCGLALVADGPGDEQAAYDLIDAMLDPQSGKALIEQFGYGHSNQKSFEIADKDRLIELGLSDPAGLFAEGVFLEEVPPAIKEKYVAIFEQVKAGI